MTVKSTSWIEWPFVALWRLVSLIFSFTGRVLAVVLGLALMAAGVLLTMTVIGAVVGIPLLIVGFLLTLRGIF